MRAARRLLALFAVGSVLLAAPARAEPPRDPARADALFQEGKQLLEAGKVAQACERLAESDALDPTVSALGLLAGCHEQQGRLTTAWREYLATAKRAGATKDERGAFAEGRAAALEPTLPRFVVSPRRPAAGLEIQCDGEPVAADALGDLRVDPGPHTLVARAPGRLPFVVNAVAAASSRVPIEVPELALLPVAPAPVPPALPPPPAPSRAPAFVAGAIGLVGVGVGAAFGVVALGKNDESRTIHETCVTAADCDRGRALRDSARGAATVSTIAFAAGLAGLGVGAVLLFRSTGEAKAPVRPAVGSSRGGARSRAGAGWLEVAPTFGAQGGGAVLSGRF